MPRPLYPRGKSPRYPWIGGWVGPRTGPEDLEKRKFLTLPGLELRPLGHPARSQSLYRPRYPGSSTSDRKFFKLEWCGPNLLVLISLFKYSWRDRSLHAATGNGDQFSSVGSRAYMNQLCVMQLLGLSLFGWVSVLKRTVFWLNAVYFGESSTFLRNIHASIFRVEFNRSFLHSL
jgi:hypothetical protein